MKEQILAFIARNGPSLPTQIAKKINQQSIFISAHLSEMKEQGKIRISHLKVGGGSPLYYLQGQESMLQNFAENLQEKEKKVFDFLRSKNVLKESELVPVFRAAIRNIRDFAFPFRIEKNDEIFWRWYLHPVEQSIRDAREMLRQGSVPEEKPAREEKKEQKKVEEQIVLLPKKLPEAASGAFQEEISKYLAGHNITIIEEISSKKTEMDLIVEIKSPVGPLRYFTRAKSKKKITDGDLSSAFIMAQSRRLPALFLAKGELTKKAQEMIDQEFRGLRFARIENGSKHS